MFLRVLDEWAGGKSHRLLRPWPGALFQVIRLEPEELAQAPRLVAEAKERARELHETFWKDLGFHRADVPRLEPAIRLTVTDARPSPGAPLPRVEGAEVVPLSDW